MIKKLSRKATTPVLQCILKKSPIHKTGLTCGADRLALAGQTGWISESPEKSGWHRRSDRINQWVTLKIPSAPQVRPDKWVSRPNTNNSLKWSRSYHVKQHPFATVHFKKVTYSQNRSDLRCWPVSFSRSAPDKSVSHPKNPVGTAGQTG